MSTPHTPKWVAVRRQLHQEPEIAFSEHKTAKTIVGHLSALPGLEIYQGIGGTGVMATLRTGNKGPEILFRAELDGLPLHEENQLPYRSQTTGQSHLCGHDGHAAILLAAADLLTQNPPKCGTVHFLFQPAEETGEGASAILEDTKLAALKPDWVFALHNLPGYPLGQVVLRKGNFNAGVRSLIFTLRGETAHAAQPENGNNPAAAMAAILLESQSLNQSDPNRADYALVVPVYARLGDKAYGTSAGEAEVHFTIRAWSAETLEALDGKLEQMAYQIANQNGLQFDVSRTESFEAMVNDESAVEAIEAAAQKESLTVKYAPTPFTWGEDFGQFTRIFRGAFFGLGAGMEAAPLHHPGYDFPDDLIEPGSRIFYQIATDLLQAAL